jgi:hypothetical protein
MRFLNRVSNGLNMAFLSKAKGGCFWLDNHTISTINERI